MVAIIYVLGALVVAVVAGAGMAPDDGRNPDGLEIFLAAGAGIFWPLVLGVLLLAAFGYGASRLGRFLWIIRRR